MTKYQPPPFLEGRGCRLDLRLPAIMGVLNVTPDSFSDGGRYSAPEMALQHALSMVEEGAAIIDVGGESTRPGSELITAAEEIDRVVPAIEMIRKHSTVPISIDTNKAAVARAAVIAGANYVNDISGLTFDPEMAAVTAEYNAGLFLMHTRGKPSEMQNNTDYQDLVGEVLDFLRRSIGLAERAGIQRNRLAVDPGIGFGKDALGNLVLLRNLEHFHSLGCPILLGTSRKSFLGRITGQGDPCERLSGTLATVALGVAQGVQIFRVHDVVQARDAAFVAWAVREQQIP